jgi:hypothetical protein
MALLKNRICEVALVMIFITFVSADLIVIQADFLKSLHLLSDTGVAVVGYVFWGVLIGLAIYPLATLLFHRVRAFPSALAAFLGAVPFAAIAAWLLLIVYLAMLTESETRSFRLKANVDKKALYQAALSKNVEMEFVTTKDGTFAWVKAKDANEAERLTAASLDTGR